jgi:hypothetical protein
VETQTGLKRGRERKIVSSLGILRLKRTQAQRLGLESYQRLSPMLEKCCLRLSANESYQKAEYEIEALMGIKVSHSTFQRLVQRTEVEFSSARQKVTQVSVDGGKVRLRTPIQGHKCEWLEYKSARVEGLYYGATFQANLELTDWLNTQPLCSLLACLGDGHDGVWNVFEAVATTSERLEILDWYHLKENLYKIGGSMRRLKQAEAFLWQGCVDEAKALFDECKLDQSRKFCNYLERHRQRIVNYAYFQAEGIPIGSGAVESSIKQIDHRMKLTGAQWNSENVPKALAVRCAYLNGQLVF